MTPHQRCYRVEVGQATGCMLWLALLLTSIGTRTARADVYRWDNNALIDGTKGIRPGPGVDFAGANLTVANLTGKTLTGADFSGADLTRAILSEATMTDVRLTNAIVKDASFASTTSHGFTREQLYSTASYQAKNLTSIGLGDNDLTGWDFSRQDLTNADFGGSELTGADFRGAIIAGAFLPYARGFTRQQLYSTASYKAKDLREIGLSSHVLAGWDLSGQDLTGAWLFQASLSRAILKGANLTGAKLQGATLSDAHLAEAIITGALFDDATFFGFTPEQLYSTASYRAKNLQGVSWSNNDLRGWDFSGQDLKGGNFESTNLAGAQLAGADTRGVFWIELTNALARNVILPDGRIPGLALSKGERLLIRDDDAEINAISCSTFGCGPMSREPVAVTITDRLQASDGSELQLLFDGDSWNSLISFEPGIPVELGGTLALNFDEGVDLIAEVGRTLQIFDWVGVTPIGEFHVKSPYVWDTTNLYSTGEVTLSSVPEPSAAMALLIGVMAIVARCRGRQAVHGAVSIHDSKERQMKLTTGFTILCLALFCARSAQADIFGNGLNTFDIEFVVIGNPGNVADTTGEPKLAGSVGKAYRIGKHEISEQIIDKANALGVLGITKDTRGADKPATSVSWNEAARFVNWINTSEGFPAAYKFATQPGEVGYNLDEDILLWRPTDAGYNAANLFRNSQAHYFLPSVDEWYKAAFYDPDANGGAGGYWNFPTGSDSVPTPVASGSAAVTAVWDQTSTFERGPADVMFSGGLSPYGVMGQGGNVWEWEETAVGLMNVNGSSGRGVRGGSWGDSISEVLSASNRSTFSWFLDDPSYGSDVGGFRVASVPEPCSLLLGALASVGVLRRRRRLS